MTTQIPTFYRIFFTTLDPLLCLGGTLSHLFFPLTILTSFTPSPLSPPLPETTVLLHSLSGWFFGMAYLQAILLRQTNDTNVWNAVQIAMVAVDIATGAGLANEIFNRVGLYFGRWTGQDWGSIVGYAALVAVRVSFLMRWKEQSGAGVGRKTD